MSKTFSGYPLEGKTKFQGLNISIENERGSFRRGTDPDGHEWATFMHIPYGYIRATEGVDGDHVDCYIGGNPHSDYVFIVHQQDPKTKVYDEDKVMLGFNTTRDARAAYERQYDRPGYFQSMTTVDMETFKDMLKSRYGMKLKPAKGDVVYGIVKGFAQGTYKDDDEDEDEKPEEGSREADFERERKNEENKDNRLKKSKYLRRWRGKDGRWHYEYPRVPKYNETAFLGGSTGARLVSYIDPETKRAAKGVLKTGNSRDHILDEYLANKVYRILGVGAPKAALHQEGNTLYQITEYYPPREGWECLSKLTVADRERAYKELHRGFVADALLANWDVVGLEYDNILFNTATGEVVRIDNGGSLRHRAQGAPKGTAFADDVGEIDTMRDMGTAGKVFGGMDESDMQRQVSDIVEHKQEILDAMPNEYLYRKMNTRIEDLRQRFPMVKSLSKAKYTRRWKGKDGKWNYEYPKDATSTGVRFVPRVGMETPIGQIVAEQNGMWAVRPKGKTDIGGPLMIWSTADLKEEVDLAIKRDAFEAKEMTQREAKRDAEIARDDLKGFESTMLPMQAGKAKSHLLNHKIRYHGEIYRNKEFAEKVVADGVVGFRDIEGKPHVQTGEKTYVQISKTLERYIRHLIGTVKSFNIQARDTLGKSADGVWLHYNGVNWQPFVWFKEPLLKAEQKYYSPEEIKARGMRWVTIRGSRVLLQGTSDGGWVVVGGAGGKLNHLKIDRILGKEEYAAKRKEQAQQKKEMRALTQEELAEQREKRKQEVAEKRVARTEYEKKVQKIIGVTEEDLRSQITGRMMDEITDKAKSMVETKRRKPIDTSNEADAEAVEKETEKIINREVQKEIKNVERQALSTLMNDYMGESDPNLKRELKKMLDSDKAMEILRAKKQFKKALKQIGTTPSEPRQPRLKVGEVFAEDSKSLDKEIIAEIGNQIETAKNIELYDKMNAQSQSIQNYVQAGNASTLNGVIGDVFGGGAVFGPESIKELGVEAVSRIFAIQAHNEGRASDVKKALEKYSDEVREKTVDEALHNASIREATADGLRDLARGDDSSEGIMSMAQANGYALKEMIAARQELGTAVGSLQGMAHMINALDDPPADAVYVDVGTDLHRARQRARKAGLARGTYKIRTQKKGRGKRLVMEIPKESVAAMFDQNGKARKQETKVERIKKLKENIGYTPPGWNMEEMTHPVTGKKGPVRLDPAQEAGLHFFRENKKVLLDFEAGIGKTPTAYAAAMEAMNNMGAKKVLIITPPKLRDQFKQEAKLFLDKDHQKLVKNTGTAKSAKVRREMYARETGIDIIGHDTVTNDIDSILASGYDMVIVDEIHKMTPQGKGKGSQRYRAMMKLQDIPLKIGMSGTNIKNEKQELYRKIEFIDPDHTLGSMAEFDKRYKGLNQGTSAFQDSSNDAFRKEVAPWVFTQRNNMPVENTQEHIRVNLTEGQRDRLRKVMDTYLKEKEAGKIGAAARRDAEMYRIVHDDAMADNSKAGEIVKLMREKHEGEKAVIHVQGIKALESTRARIEKEFGTGSVVIIKGEGEGSGVEEIRKAKAQFNDPNSKVQFIIGTKAMEEGHNLTKGAVTFHLDQPDTYASKDQRDKRVYRRGQDRNVTTYTLSGHNPLDLRKEDLILRKKKEMAIMGNPQEIDGMDGSGFYAQLEAVEQEVRGATQAAG